MSNSHNIQPLVSVIVLTYCQQSTVGQTIDNILSQRVNFPFEIVIGEDASPSDDTRAVCEQYATDHPDIIRLMPKAPNKGIVHNYIDCLRACKGQYIAVCAGDDWWCDEDKLQMQVDFLQSNPDYVLVHTEVKYLDVSTGVIAENKPRRNIPQGDVSTELFKHHFVQAPTACYRRDALSVELIDDLYSQNFAMEDLPLWLILAQQGKFYHSDRQTVVYRIDSYSASNGRTIERQLAFLDNILAVKQHYYFKFQPPFLLRDIKKAHDAKVIRILITSHDRSMIGSAIQRFGILRVLSTLCKVALSKLFASA